MKLKRLGICILTATLAFVLVGCSGLSGSKHPAGLVGTYELDSMDIKSGDKTQSITKEQYEQVSKAGNYLGAFRGRHRYFEQHRSKWTAGEA